MFFSYFSIRGGVEIYTGIQYMCSFRLAGIKLRHPLLGDERIWIKFFGGRGGTGQNLLLLL